MLALLPHAVTASRGLAGPVVAWLMLARLDHWTAFWLFVVAMLTDLIDGWLARRLGADPRWGTLLDPLADKALTISTWLSLGAVGWAPWWLAGTHVVRDVAVAAIWKRHRDRGITWTASVWGQLMTSYEGTALGVLLFHGPFNGTHWPTVGVVLGATSLALSVVSVVAYLVTGPPTPSAPLDGPSPEA